MTSPEAAKKKLELDQARWDLKVEYEFDGTEYFTWTDNLSPKTWFGPLFVEEKKFITLVVDRQRPERFLVYPFCGHLVPSSSRGREA